MGTSKGYLPPTGYLWPDAKRDVTKMVKDNFTPSSVDKAISNFAKALNGSTGSGANAGRAIQSGGKALSFIDSVRKYGLSETLDRFGLSNLKNETPENVRRGLLKYFSDSGNEFYDGISNQSMNELMRELFKGIKDVNGYEEVLKSLDTGEFIREFIIKFIQNCFFANFTEKLLSLFDNIDKYKVAEKNVKTYIRNTIEKNFSVQKIQNVDWNGTEGNQILNNTYKKTLEILSVWREINE
ncbi:hypothetical protein LAV73_03140 [Lysinibacillus xylanilyticus]|uniref:hypothetical protein n=1 Tax=Lysinibacillus xylanilyticus TaxID=582475 RepID=UPI002B24191D|nr:hypothetical protein [Lysinibacillus xylanilyticus]MEB2278996.1 hypothetical protein [Lysinibacillus xylanilyticus]